MVAKALRLQKRYSCKSVTVAKALHPQKHVAVAALVAFYIRIRKGCIEASLLQLSFRIFTEAKVVLRSQKHYNCQSITIFILNNYLHTRQPSLYQTTIFRQIYLCNI